MVINNRKFKQLIKQGLTGREAAKLVLQDNWLVDNGNRGYLSGTDILSIKQSLKSDEDIDEYNAWIEFYRILWFTLTDVKTLHLQIINRMLSATTIIQEYEIYYLFKRFKEHAPDKLPQLERYQSLIASKQKAEGSKSEKQKYLLDDLHKLIKQEVKEFLAAQVIIDATARLIEIPFFEQMDTYYQDILTYLDDYNKVLNRTTDYLKLKKLSLARLGPDKKEQTFVEQRIGRALGPNWFQEYLLTKNIPAKENKDVNQTNVQTVREHIDQFLKETLTSIGGG